MGMSLHELQYASLGHYFQNDSGPIILFVTSLKAQNPGGRGILTGQVWGTGSNLSHGYKARKYVKTLGDIVLLKVQI